MTLSVLYCKVNSHQIGMSCRTRSSYHHHAFKFTLRLMQLSNLCSKIQLFTYLASKIVEWNDYVVFFLTTPSYTMIVFDFLSGTIMSSSFVSLKAMTGDAHNQLLCFNSIPIFKMCVDFKCPFNLGHINGCTSTQYYQLCTHSQ